MNRSSALLLGLPDSQGPSRKSDIAAEDSLGTLASEAVPIHSRRPKGELRSELDLTLASDRKHDSRVFSKDAAPSDCVAQQQKGGIP